MSAGGAPARTKRGAPGILETWIYRASILSIIILVLGGLVAFLIVMSGFYLSDFTTPPKRGQGILHQLLMIAGLGFGTLVLILVAGWALVARKRNLR